MSLESAIADLVSASTGLVSAVNVLSLIHI